ncbi:MAG: response regulator transcription factor [Campylobacteraceae bacterium]|nr:response regulator transcription factor [Campylobacteraceae bacterium]
MNNLTILYAEDEDQTRENYVKFLNKYFKEVYSASNGKEALELYKNKKPNILLLDINMPFINGLQLAKEIRIKDKNTRIIILTAHLEQDKLLFAAELNLTKYLPKPVTRSELKLALFEASNQYKELNAVSNLINLDENHIWNKDTLKLFKNNEEIKLTKHEILLFDILSSKENRIFTIDEISFHLWNDIEDYDVSTNKLKDIIKRVRKKIPKNSIENVYAAGYKLNRI